jgi:hypothetical protein
VRRRGPQAHQTRRRRDVPVHSSSRFRGLRDPPLPEGSGCEVCVSCVDALAARADRGGAAMSARPGCLLRKSPGARGFHHLSFRAAPDVWGARGCRRRLEAPRRADIRFVS